jgi:hypothetical protein
MTTKKASRMRADTEVAGRVSVSDLATFVGVDPEIRPSLSSAVTRTKTRTSSTTTKIRSP